MMKNSTSIIRKFESATIGKRGSFAALGFALLAWTLLVVFAAKTDAATLTVTTTADSGAGSLRQAAIDAASGDTINFTIPTGCVSGVCTITLTSGEIVIGKTLTIINTGGASRINISGNNASRIFSSSVTGTVLTLEYLNLINGNGVGAAGSNNGGAIYAGSSTLTINNTTIANNSVSAGGGAIYAATGTTLNITNSTIGNNKSGSSGGAIYLRSTTTATGAIIKNSTIAFNSATVSGGGIYIFNNAAVSGSAQNTIIASNTAPAQPDIFRGGSSGAFTSGGNNLVGSTDTNGNISFRSTAPSADITNQSPLLASLGFYGGLNLTYALTTGSPAIDAGSQTGAPPRDQRGLQRATFVTGAGTGTQPGPSDIGAFELQTGEFIKTRFDFDADGKADLSVYRDGTWYYLNSSGNGFSGVQFGVASDKIVPADYDGDGKTDLAVFRENTGDPNRAQFFILQSATNTVRGEQFGRTGDVPVAGDWDRDGKADLAVYRAGASSGAQSYFFYRPSGTSGVDFRAVVWGSNGDVPVVGDYDGDGQADAAVFRPSTTTWYILQSGNGTPRYLQFGLATDRLVPADYDGDGQTDVAVFRDGTWYLQQSQAGFAAAQFGASGDIPTPADYDGDGRADFAVFRGGTWYLQQSSRGFAASQFGLSTDRPVPAAFVR